MYRTAQTMPIWSGEFVSGWEQTLSEAIRNVEAAEFDLVGQGSDAAVSQRKDSGSYYTPADVADHAWSLFFRFHHLTTANSLRAFIARTQFVEPSAGSGIFVFTFLKKALEIGLQPGELSQVRFSVIDINLAAMRFFADQLRQLESALGISLPGIGVVQRDFLEWANTARFDNVAFVGNPPFVANERGSRWRNLFADFLEAMLEFPAIQKSVSLVLPISICFSRDYLALRQAIQKAGLGVSASSYDNIPDSLFKSGKPESRNTNRANSQRCTILNLGGPDSSLREAAPLQRWATRERAKVLASIPVFQDFSGYAFDEQIPRPGCERIMRYLSTSKGEPPVRSLLTKCGKPGFAVAGVGRNFIGIRDAALGDTSAIPIRASTEENRLVLLQILGSSVFYDYWRTVGDGFHVTTDLIERFPVTPRLLEQCVARVSDADATWRRRKDFAKEKLNSGRVIRSYDLGAAFSYLRV